MNWKPVALLAAGLLVGVGLGSLLLLERPDANEPLSPSAIVGDAVADFRLSAVDGETIRLSDYRGKAVVINFWATWCPPCEEEMPLLEQTYRDAGGELVVLGINYEESQPVVAEFVDARGLTFPILLDPDGRVARQFFVRNFPSTFFIDAEGVLRSQFIGPLDAQEIAIHLQKAGLVP